MSFLSIDGKEKLYKVSSFELLSVLYSQSDSFRETLRNAPSTSGEFIFGLHVTVNDETTPKHLRCFISVGGARATLDGRGIDYERQNITFYDKIFVWEGGFANRVFDMEECFPRFRVYAIPQPTLVSEVRAIKNLLIQAISKIQTQEKEQKQQEDELGALD